MNRQSIIINLCDQTLQQLENDKLLHQYLISSALNGPGEQMDSECTPRGKHIIQEKIGGDAEVNAVFVGRKPTGEIYHSALKQAFPDRDWILTRILWLSGQEPSRNLGGPVDTHDRYIYIHGTPDEVEMGVPGSRGCIRMRNRDIIGLFDWVKIGCPVDIIE